MTTEVRLKDCFFLLLIFFIGFSQAFLYVTQSLIIFFIEIVVILLYQKNGLFRIKYRDKRSVLYGMLWMFSFTFSMLFNNRIEIVSILRFIETLTHVLFAYHLAQVVYKEKVVIYVCYSITIPMVVVIVSMICIYNYPYFLYSEFIYGLKYNRVSEDWFNNPPFYAHIRHSGFHNNIALVCSIFLVFHYFKRNILVFFCNVVILIILMSFLIWTGGRGAILSVLIALSISFMLSPLFRKQAIIIICCILLSTYVSELFRVYEWNGVFRVYDSFSEEKIEAISSGRASLWIEALNTLNAKSIWFGHGAESFYLLGVRDYHIQPHNFIIQFLMEWGIIGTVLFFLFVYNVFKPFFKVKYITLIVKKNVNVLPPIMIIVSTVSLAFTDGSLFYSQPIFYLSLAIALLYKAQGALPVNSR